MAAFAHALREAWPDGPLKLGNKVGESKQYISQIMRGSKEPRRSLVFELERAVGLPLGALSHLLGYLPVGAWSTEEAIMADGLLSPTQKRQLLAAYRRAVGAVR